VWGGLVPWGKVWRLGANEATLPVINKPIAIGGITIPGGAYTLYLIPSEQGSTQLAFSSNIGKWGLPVDETDPYLSVWPGTVQVPTVQATVAEVQEADNNALPRSTAGPIM